MGLKIQNIYEDIYLYIFIVLILLFLFFKRNRIIGLLRNNYIKLYLVIIISIILNIRLKLGMLLSIIYIINIFIENKLFLAKITYA